MPDFPSQPYACMAIHTCTGHVTGLIMAYEASRADFKGAVDVWAIAKGLMTKGEIAHLKLVPEDRLNTKQMKRAT